MRKTQKNSYGFSPLNMKHTHTHTQEIKKIKNKKKTFDKFRMS